MKIHLHNINLEREALHELFSTPEGLPEGSSAFESNIIGNDDIAIRRSLIPGAGRGAFARRKFEAGEKLGEFKCAMVGSEEPSSKYTWNVNETHACDSISMPLYNPVMYINSIAAEGSCSRQNADLSILPSGELFYVATKAVMEGEELLVDYGPNYFIDSGTPYECHMTELHRASARGDFETARSLLSDPQVRHAVDSLDASGWTPLMLACENGYLNVVKLLAEAGSDLNRQATSGTNAAPLHIAAENGHTGIVKFLLDKSKMTINLEMSWGFTPLMLAAGRGHIDTAEVLIQSGASVFKALEDGGTAITIASHYGHTEIVEMLSRTGTHLNENATTGISANRSKTMTDLASSHQHEIEKERALYDF